MYRGRPYYQYQVPYGYAHPQVDEAAYLRALAEEEAARDQYLAAHRAQEEARERAARARLARQFNSPYNSYLDEDSDEGGYSGYGSAQPRSRQHAAEEQRRRELQERLRLDQERRLLEEEKRRIDEEKRRRLLEEERRRRLVEEERRRQQEQEASRHHRQSGNFVFDPIMQALGIDPNQYGDKETMPSRGPMRRGEPGASYQGIPPQDPVKTASRGLSRQRSQGKMSSRSVSVPPPKPPVKLRAEKNSSPRAQRVPSPDKESVRIPISTPQQPAPKPGPSPKSMQPASPKPVLTDKQREAALKIRHAYLKHAPRLKALRTLSGIQANFENVRTNFYPPDHLDYRLSSSNPNEHIRIPTDASTSSVDVPIVLQLPAGQRTKLAYTSNNAVVHAYLEELTRLLSAIDTVESGGDAVVRARRKDLARNVELEAERVDAWTKEVWDAWASKTNAAASASVPGGDPVERTTHAAVPSELGARELEPAVQPMDIEQLQHFGSTATGTAQEPAAPIIYYPVDPAVGFAAPAAPVIYHPVEDLEAMEVEPAIGESVTPAAPAKETWSATPTELAQTVADAVLAKSVNRSAEAVVADSSADIPMEVEVLETASSLGEPMLMEPQRDGEGESMLVDSVAVSPELHVTQSTGAEMEHSSRLEHHSFSPEPAADQSFSSDRTSLPELVENCFMDAELPSEPLQTAVVPVTSVAANYFAPEVAESTSGIRTPLDATSLSGKTEFVTATTPPDLPLPDPVSDVPDTPIIVHPLLSGNVSNTILPLQSPNALCPEAIDAGAESDEEGPLTPPLDALRMSAPTIVITSQDGATTVELPGNEPKEYAYVRSPA